LWKCECADWTRGRTTTSRSHLHLRRWLRAYERFCEEGTGPLNAVLTVADLAVDGVNHTVQRAGHNIELSPKEFALLEYLMRYAGQPVTRTAIVEQVWKLNFDSMTNVVDVYINYLRYGI
jgi:two-component system OmpR family response regulator